MTSFREIGTRINAVKNVQQITQAMEMVAASYLKKAQTRMQHSRLYERKMDEIFLSLNLMNPKRLLPEAPKKLALVVIAGDKGLCGSYHSHLFNRVSAFLKPLKKEQVDLFLFGRKAISFFAEKKWPILAKIENWGGKFSKKQLMDLTLSWISSLTDHTYDGIAVIHTRFDSFLTRHVELSNLSEHFSRRPNFQESTTLYEPSQESLYRELFPRYLASKMQLYLDEAYTAELAARAFSMRKATNNAKEMVEQLTLKRNKIRQAGITREMIEITAGAQGV